MVILICEYWCTLFFIFCHLIFWCNQLQCKSIVSCIWFDIASQFYPVISYWFRWSVGKNLTTRYLFTLLSCISHYFLPWKVWLYILIINLHPWTNSNAPFTIYTGGNILKLCTKYIVWCAFPFICTGKPLNQLHIITII